MHVFIDEFDHADRRVLRQGSGAAGQAGSGVNPCKYDNKPYDDINITPMLDLAYVLLVIFIIMTTASVQGIKVNLPKASAAPSLAKPKTKAITITQRRQDVPRYLPGDAGRARAAAGAAARADAGVSRRGARRRQIQYQKVVDVLDLLGRLNITQVGLATKPLVR